MSARFKFKDLPRGGCCGAIELHAPDVPGKLIVAAVGDDRADALAKAALLAERISNDPVMRALMPPQATAAIKAAKGLAAAAKRGKRTLRRVWGRIHGPGKRRLAKALHDDRNAIEPEPASYDDEDEGNDDELGRRRRRRRHVTSAPPAPASEPAAELDEDDGSQLEKTDDAVNGEGDE